MLIDNVTPAILILSSNWLQSKPKAGILSCKNAKTSGYAPVIHLQARRFTLSSCLANQDGS